MSMNEGLPLPATEERRKLRCPRCKRLICELEIPLGTPLTWRGVCWWCSKSTIFELELNKNNLSR